MGVVSNGMLCSGDELGLTSDADGILILPTDAPLGAALTDLYGDIVLDVDVKPNRGDALSLVGLAREVSAVTGAPVRFPETDPPETGPPIAERLRVDVEEPGLCTRFVGRWVGGVTVGPSPDLVQMRLLAAGQRPVSNVVDVSNYVMLELGKPIHTFDAPPSTTAGSSSASPVQGERLETLDHIVRELTPDTLIIADPEGPIGIAGVMGGAESEIGPDDARTSSSSRRSSTRSASGGRPSATRSAPRRASASRRARSIGSRSSVPTGRPGSSPSGPVGRSRSAPSTRTRPSHRRRGSPSDRRVSIA